MFCSFEIVYDMFCLLFYVGIYLLLYSRYSNIKFYLYQKPMKFWWICLHYTVLLLLALQNMQTSYHKFIHSKSKYPLKQHNIFIYFLINSSINFKRIFFRLSEVWNIFSPNMIKCHIFSRTGTADEIMWHFITLSENIYQMSRKTNK
jgi:hypothetical protein